MTAPLAGGVAFAADTLPAGPGRDLVYGHCRTCHSLQYLTDSSGIDRAQWASVLKSMRQLGMPALGGDRDKILDYLGNYLGPNPPAKAAAASGQEQTAEAADGETVFKQQCASCHQPNGQGVPGQFPPLAGNRDLFLKPDFPALVVLSGMKGKISVEGKSFAGEMPAFDYLSDEQIAAVVHYIRSAWGNASLRPKGMAKVTAESVKSARGKSMSAAAVHGYRQSLE